MGSYQEGTTVGMWLVMMAMVVMLGMVDRMEARPQLFQVETNNKEGLIRSFLAEVHVGGRNPVITEITTEPFKKDAEPQKEANQDYSDDEPKTEAGSQPEVTTQSKSEDEATEESKPEEENNVTTSNVESNDLSTAGSN